MGTNAVGAMIVAGAQGLAKNQYRKFNIKCEGLTPGDDYAMMREVLTRRFKRVAAELAGSAPTERRATHFPSPRPLTGRGQRPADRRPRVRGGHILRIFAAPHPNPLPASGRERG